MPPAHILNAPTRLMKDLGYGAGYAYDHAAEEAFSGQNYFPDGMAARALLPAARPRLRTRDREAAGDGRSCARSGRGSRAAASRSASRSSWAARSSPAVIDEADILLFRTADSKGWIPDGPHLGLDFRIPGRVDEPQGDRRFPEAGISFTPWHDTLQQCSLPVRHTQSRPADAAPCHPDLRSRPSSRGQSNMA